MVDHYRRVKRKNNSNFFDYYFFRYHRLFFGSIIFRGRKLWAFKFFGDLKSELKQRERLEPNLVFFFSMVRITPNVLLFPYKIGGKVEGVPMAIGWEKRLTFATKWVVKMLRDKHKGRISLKDAAEALRLAIYGKGSAMHKNLYFNSLSTRNRYLIKYLK